MRAETPRSGIKARTRNRKILISVNRFARGGRRTGAGPVRLDLHISRARARRPGISFRPAAVQFHLGRRASTAVEAVEAAEAATAASTSSTVRPPTKRRS